MRFNLFFYFLEKMGETKADDYHCVTIVTIHKKRFLSDHQS